MTTMTRLLLSDSLKTCPMCLSALTDGASTGTSGFLFASVTGSSWGTMTLIDEEREPGEYDQYRELAQCPGDEWSPRFGGSGFLGAGLLRVDGVAHADSTWHQTPA
jgi:hypothetical protein